MYGHVVVDEAQDHSAVALRVIGRRSPAASMTLVGDVAQSTAPAGQERWADVFAYLDVTAVGDVAELTIGYRVPEPILSVANRLLPLTGVDASASRSVRVEGHAPTWVHAVREELPAAVAAEARPPQAPPPSDRRRRSASRCTGDRDGARRRRARTPSITSTSCTTGEVPMFGPEQVKGLEFDGVVVVEPDEILDGTARGARLLYVAMTRAVQELSFVTTSSRPTPALG